MSKVFKKIGGALKKGAKVIKKVFKKVGKAVKKLVQKLGPILPIVLMFIPGIGQAAAGMFASMGVGTTAATIMGNALVSGVASGTVAWANGGKFGKGFVKGAVAGGLSAGVGAYAGELGLKGASLGAVKGAVAGAVTGGARGAIMGGITGSLLGTETAQNAIKAGETTVKGWFSGTPEQAVEAAGNAAIDAGQTPTEAIDAITGGNPQGLSSASYAIANSGLPASDQAAIAAEAGTRFGAGKPFMPEITIVKGTAVDGTGANLDGSSSYTVNYRASADMTNSFDILNPNAARNTLTINGVNMAGLPANVPQNMGPVRPELVSSDAVGRDATGTLRAIEPQTESDWLSKLGAAAKAGSSLLSGVGKGTSGAGGGGGGEPSLKAIDVDSVGMSGVSGDAASASAPQGMQQIQPYSAAQFLNNLASIYRPSAA